MDDLTVDYQYDYADNDDYNYCDGYGDIVMPISYNYLHIQSGHWYMAANDNKDYDYDYGYAFYEDFNML